MTLFISIVWAGGFVVKIKPAPSFLDRILWPATLGGAMYLWALRLLEERPTTPTQTEE